MVANKDKKKILFIENSVSHKAPGGSHKSLINLYDNLDFDKIEPFILLNEKNKMLTELMGNRNTYYLQHQTLDIKPNSKPGGYKQTNSTYNFSIFKANLGILYRLVRDVLPMTIKTINLIKKLDIDLVHTNTRIGSNQFGIIAAWLCGKKLVSHERIWTKKNWLNRLIFNFPDKIICISNSIKDNLLKIGVDRKKCTVIFNGRALPDIKKAFQKKYDDTSSFFNIGIMANISEYKGHSIFVKSAVSLLKKYPGMKFYIYGDTLTPDSKYLNKLKKIISENNCNDKIIFMGYVKEVNEIIQKLHINCCLTIGDEPLSGTIIESMLNKTVIISTKTGGSSEIITHKITGFLIKPDSVNDFVNAVDFLFKNRQFCKKITEEGYQFSKKNLTSKAYTKKVMQIYNEVLY